jgi:hypothetical protein
VVYVAKPKKVDAGDTKEKICEAQYFLQRMVENRNDPNPFKFNLSAFLTAFDSIWDFMNRELRVLKLEVCNNNLQQWGRSDPEIRLLRESRNITTHRRIIQKRNDVTIYLEKEPRAEYTWYFVLDKDIKNIPDIGRIVQTDAITICQACFKELARHISACDEGLLQRIC